jgi:hypothetical protein
MSQEMTKFNFEITSMKDAMEYAKLISDSDLAPKDYKGKPGNVLIAIQYGVEIGLKPMQAIQNIAVINGRPAIWGDAMIALVQNHPLCEYIKEEFKNDTAYCIVKRRGEEEHVSHFSKADAKTAGLLGKAGVWQQYPERMLKMRARGFALRDKFADVLKGIAMREEVMDYQVIENIDQKKTGAQSKIAALIESKSKPAIESEPVSEKMEFVSLEPEFKSYCEKILACKNKDDLKKVFDCLKVIDWSDTDYLPKLIDLKDKQKQKFVVDEFNAEYDKADAETGEIK